MIKKKCITQKSFVLMKIYTLISLLKVSQYPSLSSGDEITDDISETNRTCLSTD